MIVRIATEGQYELDDGEAGRLNELDNAVVAAVENGSEARYKELFDEMLGLVRKKGKRVPDDELVGSDAILPPPDLTFEEAGEQFSGEGILPG